MFNTIYLSEYKFILYFLIVSILLSCGFFFLSYFLSYKELYIEKHSAYECGFNPFEDARNKFDIRFYLVGILFLVFDLEIAVFYPLAVSLYNVSLYGF